MLSLVFCPLCTIFAEKPSLRALMMVTMFMGIPYWPSKIHNRSLLMLSKALSKAIQLMYNEDCHLTLCSTILPSVTNWSVKLRPARNPACSSRSFPTSAVLVRSKITLQNTLVAMYKSMPPRQFLHINSTVSYNLNFISLINCSSLERWRIQ